MGFLPAYRVEKWENGRKNSSMVGKIPTWSEKFRHGRKYSDMVGKFPSLAGLYDNRICCTGPPEPVIVKV
jgi:hypothetical protein